MKKRRMFLRMITASLMRRRSRMLVAFLAIAIGATILSGLMTIYFDVPRQMGAQFRNYGANMIFTPTGEDFTNEDLEKGLSHIKSTDLVGAAPYRYETVRIHEQPIMAASKNKDIIATNNFFIIIFLLICCAGIKADDLLRKIKGPKLKCISDRHTP